MTAAADKSSAGLPASLTYRQVSQDDRTGMTLNGSLVREWNKLPERMDRQVLNPSLVPMLILAGAILIGIFHLGILGLSF